MADVVGALVEILKADGNVAARAGDRVFGGEVPQREARHMPRQALLVKPSGGVSLTGGSYAEHDTQRIDLFGYGATPMEAAELVGIAALVMRRVNRAVAADTLIHWCQPAGGFSSGREPNTDWPRVFMSFQVFAALESVA